MSELYIPIERVVICFQISIFVLLETAVDENGFLKIKL